MTYSDVIGVAERPLNHWIQRLNESAFNVFDAIVDDVMRRRRMY